MEYNQALSALPKSSIFLITAFLLISATALRISSLPFRFLKASSVAASMTVKRSVKILAVLTLIMQGIIVEITFLSCELYKTIAAVFNLENHEYVW